MKLTKRILAGLLAVSMVIPMAACGKDTEVESQVDVVTVPTSDTIVPLGDDVTKTIKWMADYDLNPGIGGERSTALALFEDSSGGKIEYVQTAWDTKFDDLAAAIMANTPPDIFPYHWMAFPYQITKGMYQPVDEIVDFTSPLWSDVAETADQFVLNGSHYVAPISFAASSIMVYDKNIIEDNGLDDPWELYQAGNWNWDSWKSIMSDWMSLGSEEEIHYGVNGWFQPHIVQQTGKTMVTLENNQFVNNIDDPDIERAEKFLYDLGKDGYVENYWYGSARNCFNTGTTLFYAMGAWASTGTANGPTEDSNWGVVPLPADPVNPQRITTSDMTAYMWVKGSTANEAVKAWFECNRIAETEEQYEVVNREKFFATNEFWTEEMYEAMQEVIAPENLQIFDYGYGISSTMSDDNSAADGYSIMKKLYEYVNQTEAESGAQYTWAQIRETYSTAVDAELAAINAEVAKLNG